MGLLFLIGLIVLVAVLICKTKEEDMGCDFDCKNCPFQPCSKEEVERMKKKRGMNNGSVSYR